MCKVAAMRDISQEAERPKLGRPARQPDPEVVLEPPSFVFSGRSSSSVASGQNSDNASVSGQVTNSTNSPQQTNFTSTGSSVNKPSTSRGSSSSNDGGNSLSSEPVASVHLPSPIQMLAGSCHPRDQSHLLSDLCLIQMTAGIRRIRVWLRLSVYRLQIQTGAGTRRLCQIRPHLPDTHLLDQSGHHEIQSRLTNETMRLKQVIMDKNYVYL